MNYILSLALLAGAASAHTIGGILVVGGVQYPWGHAIRVPSYDGPINDVRSNSMACNGPPNDPPIANPNVVVQVQAGTTIQVKWQHEKNNPNMVVDASHKGPVMAYLKKVGDATTDSGVGGGWFKVSEDGLASDNRWGVDRLISSGGVQNIPIPACIAPGQYLVRVELIALHAAGSSGGAQLYMECGHLEILGGGSTSPPTVSFPGAYSANDPGLLINIYNPPPTSYTIPGPRPFSCGGTPPSTTSVRPTTTLIPTTSTSIRPTTTFTTTPSTTSSPTSTATGGGGTQTQYGQCGGTGWSGPTGCVSPFTCRCQNQWYCQCLS